LRPGLEHPAEAVEDVADGLAGGHLPGQLGDGQEGVADGLGGDAGVGERGLELGIGLGVRGDEAADVNFHLGVPVLGGRPPPRLEMLDAADARTEFVQAGGDGVASPPEGGLGQAGGTAAVGVSHLRLEPPPLVPGEQCRGEQDGPPRVAREFCHDRLLREAHLIADPRGRR